MFPDNLRPDSDISNKNHALLFINAMASMQWLQCNDSNVMTLMQ